MTNDLTDPTNIPDPLGMHLPIYLDTSPKDVSALIYGETPALLAENLSAKHIGAHVTITAPGVSYTGHIESFAFDIGRSYCGVAVEAVRVEFRGATITFPLGATVEVL